jgi:maltose alpha-D-glucosyltransferase/alpha-amylase
VGLHDQWYKNAIIYCIDVETFADSNGDGVGDFRGLSSRLDYLSGLGVNCIWLMPIFPTPNRDDGYDVMDYTTVDARLGSMADFTEFMVEATERGMHVLMDLIPNHTSDQHPWFQQARTGKKSPYYDYYVWREDDPGDTSGEVVFPGEQDGIWSYEEQAKAWYLHRFYPFQPDLNFANPLVRDEFRQIMGLWLQQGIHGFRIDAAPFLQDDHGGPESAHTFLQELRDFAIVRKGNAVLLGEVDVGLSTLADYFGAGNELQALFNFHLNRYVFLGLAQESADPIKFGLEQLPTIPGSGQWVNFLRHHDELNLSRITKAEREEVFERFGPQAKHQVYNRGLRRRLAPMLDGDPARLKLAYSLLFSLPGAPMIFYGEEIGMGENLALPGRLAVRGLMQWTSYGHGGFSEAHPRTYVRPMLAEDPYGFRNVSVSKQRGERDSLMNWMAGLLRTRRECGEIGTGSWSAFPTGTDAVLGLTYEVPDSRLLIVNNLSGRTQRVRLDAAKAELTCVTEMFADSFYPEWEGDEITLKPFGFRWLRLGGVY